jgi:hypothetical protein
MRQYLLAAALALCCLARPVAAGQSPPASQDDLAAMRAEMTALRKQMEEQQKHYEAQISELRQKVDDLSRTAVKPAPSLEEELAAAVEKAKGEVPKTEPGLLSMFFNKGSGQSSVPDISVLGDMLGHYVADHHNAPNPAQQEDGKRHFRFREMEIAFAAPVDPHSKADLILTGGEDANGEWNMELEEGYLTLTTLPYDLQARFGKFRTVFGKNNPFHTHAMAWVDRPDVIANFLGPDGMAETGAEVSWLVPNPWKKYIEWTAALQNNGNPESFAGDRQDDVMFTNHVKYFDNLTPATTAELGGSVATGANGDGSGGRTTLEGADLTIKWKPPGQGLYKALTWQSEVILSQKDRPDGATVSSWGAYSSLEYQFARQWRAFARWDYSEFPDDAQSKQLGGAVGLTYDMSEYCYWRFEYKHTSAQGPLAGQDRDELWLQLNFGIGPHQAHKY